MSQSTIVIKTKANIVSITVKQGCITKEQVDVVINSTTPGLILKAGALSRVILEAAGDEIQQQCNRITSRLGNVKPGQLACTSAGRMPAKYIYHGTLPTDLKETQYMALHTFLRCCFGRGNKDSMTSMAIPAMATGNLGAPPPEVANVMYEEIKTFSKENPNTTLKDIRIILPEPKLYTDFSRCLWASSRNDGLHSSVHSSSVKPEDQPPDGIHLTIRTKQDICVRIRKGDLSKSKTAAILNVTTKDLRLNHGAISSSILRAAGDSIQLECNQTAPDGIDYNETVVTASGKLQCDCIYHVAIQQWNKETDEAPLRKAIANVLCAVHADRRASLAIPPLGTGRMLRYHPRVAARCICDEINTFSGANPTTQLRQIEIFSIDMTVIREFVDYCTTDISYKVEKPATSPEHSDCSPGVRTTNDPDVFAHINVAFQALRASLERLSDTRRDRIKRRTEQVLTAMPSDQLISSAQEPPAGATSTAQNGTHEASRLVQQKPIVKTETPDPVINNDGGIPPLPGRKPLTKYRQAMTLPRVHKDSAVEGAVAATTQLSRGPSGILRGRSASERRAQVTSLGISLPVMWSHMATDTIKKENLKPLSVEHQQVLKRFIAARGSPNITEITRLQCSDTFQLYTVKRREVEKTISDPAKFNVEKVLYHGTSRDVLDGISQEGFNRSFCGKNATAFGQGTYFATSAAYSSQRKFARPDADGYQYVLQCRVITGEYTLGDPTYKLSPENPNSDKKQRFHSVVDNMDNPTIFVVFHDAQAYPEYLIKFKQ